MDSTRLPGVSGLYCQKLAGVEELPHAGMIMVSETCRNGDQVNTEFLIAGVVWYVVFLLSTTCHETAHAWAAKLGGDLTAFHGGQVSLDPIPHIRRETFCMVSFPLLTYATRGWLIGCASAHSHP